MAAPRPPAKPAPDAPGGREPDAYRPTTRRRQLLLAVLAVVTVVVIAVQMLRPHQQLMGAKDAGAVAKLNAELAKTWPVISERQEPPEDASGWNGIPNKLELLKR